MPRIGAVALVVRDYDEAIAFYVDALGFAVVEDDSVAGEEKIAGINHRSVRRGQNRGSGGGCDVHAGVRAARLIIEDTPEAKGA